MISSHYTSCTKRFPMKMLITDSQRAESQRAGKADLVVLAAFSTWLLSVHTGKALNSVISAKYIMSKLLKGHSAYFTHECHLTRHKETCNVK